MMLYPSPVHMSCTARHFVSSPYILLYEKCELSHSHPGHQHWQDLQVTCLRTTDRRVWHHSTYLSLYVFAHYLSTEFRGWQKASIYKLQWYMLSVSCGLHYCNLHCCLVKDLKSKRSIHLWYCLWFALTHSVSYQQHVSLAKGRACNLHVVSFLLFATHVFRQPQYDYHLHYEHWSCYHAPCTIKNVIPKLIRVNDTAIVNRRLVRADDFHLAQSLTYGWPILNRSSGGLKNIEEGYIIGGLNLTVYVVLPSFEDTVCFSSSNAYSSPSWALSVASLFVR